MSESDPDGHVPGDFSVDAATHGDARIIDHEQYASQSRATGENLGAQIGLLFLHARRMDEKLSMLHLRLMEMTQQIEALANDVKQPETKERLREKFQKWGKA